MCTLYVLSRKASCAVEFIFAKENNLYTCNFQH